MAGFPINRLMRLRRALAKADVEVLVVRFLERIAKRRRIRLRRADDAGVGLGALVRRFPTRAALLARFDAAASRLAATVVQRLGVVRFSDDTAQVVRSFSVEEWKTLLLLRLVNRNPDNVTGLLRELAIRYMPDFTELLAKVGARVRAAGPGWGPVQVTRGCRSGSGELGDYVVFTESIDPATTKRRLWVLAIVESKSRTNTPELYPRKTVKERLDQLRRDLARIAKDGLTVETRSFSPDDILVGDPGANAKDLVTDLIAVVPPERGFRAIGSIVDGGVASDVWLNSFDDAEARAVVSLVEAEFRATMRAAAE